LSETIYSIHLEKSRRNYRFDQSCREVRQTPFFRVYWMLLCRLPHL
jgi:hypothetical protein